MGRRLVLDASLIASYLLPDESSFVFEAVLRAQAGGLVICAVPANGLIEVAQAVVGAVRRNRLDTADAEMALERLTELPIAVLPGVDPRAVFRLALANRLTAYDASYLAVALSTGGLLASGDKDLARAAHELGILWTPPATIPA